MPCGDEKIDGKIIQERRYHEHHNIVLNLCYTHMACMYVIMDTR